MLIEIKSLYGLPSTVNVTSSTGQNTVQTYSSASATINAGAVNYGVPGKNGQGADPQFIADTEQRLADLEEATDGNIGGVDPLYYYILSRDN